jgi:hypothetical protein
MTIFSISTFYLYFSLFLHFLEVSTVYMNFQIWQYIFHFFLSFYLFFSSLFSYNSFLSLNICWQDLHILYHKKYLLYMYFFYEKCFNYSKNNLNYIHIIQNLNIYFKHNTGYSKNSLVPVLVSVTYRYSLHMF